MINIFCFICVLFSVVYLPSIIGSSIATLLKYTALIFMALTISLNMKSVLKKDVIVKIYPIILAVLFQFILYIVSMFFDLLYPITQIEINVIVFLFVLFGIAISQKKGLLSSKCLICILLVNLIVMIVSFIKYGITFSVSEVYLMSAKNSVSALYLILSLVALLYLILPTNNCNSIFNNSRIVGVLFYFIFSVGILLIRGRTSLLTLFVITILILYNRRMLSLKGLFRVVLLSLCSLVLFFFVFDIYLPDLIIESFTIGRDVNDFDSITSGRGTRNLVAIDTFCKYPFLGLLTEGYSIPWPHNYILDQLSSYGIIGFFPSFILYVYFAKKIICNIFKSTNCDNNVSFLLLALYITSLAEPTYPFSPGTISFLPFTLFGMNLMKTDIIKH